MPTPAPDRDPRIMALPAAEIRRRFIEFFAERGHTVQVMPTVAGGMNAIQFHDDGSMTGAACWRADGVAVAMGGGLARAGVRFVLPG